MTSIRVENGNTAFKSDDDGVLFNKDGLKLLQYPAGKTGSYPIPNATKTIEQYAFCGCKITSVTIPNGAAIGSYAFYESSLTSVTIPSGANLLSISPFGRCYNMASIKVESGNKLYLSEGGVLFNKKKTTLYQYPCGKTGHYEIPSTVNIIGSEAFAGCSRLTSVTIPDSVTRVSDLAFSDTGLKTVAIPKNVSDIQSGAFCACPDLMEIIVDSNNYYYTSVDGVLFRKQDGKSSGRLLVQFPAGKGGSYSIPSNTTRIFNNAFNSCDKLTSVTIPANVTKINSDAFRNCHSLKNVIYEGKTDPCSGSSNIFDACESLSFICVPEDYNSSSFCSLSFFVRGKEKCENHCYEVVENNGTLVVQKRVNATSWEEQKNGCGVFYCDNETGGMFNSSCSTNEICVNDVCAPEDLLNDSIYVILDFGDNDNVQLINIDVNVTLKHINDLGDFNITTIVVETNDEGHVVKVFVILDNEEDAKMLEKSVRDKCIPEQ